MAGLVPAIHVFRLSKRHAGGPDYLFLPTDAKLEGRSWDQSTVVNWEALQGAIETSKGRRIMLVDTCHSGNAFNARLLKDAADASIAPRPMPRPSRRGGLRSDMACSPMR
jgi:hypothetical protein